jgi:hypothetical protein
LGAVRLAFRAQFRDRWRSWLTIAILISVVGGVVLAAAAAGRRTESAFPRLVDAHGFDAFAFATQPIPKIGKLPQFTSVTQAVAPDNGQPTCACTHPINPNDFGIFVVSPNGISPVQLVSGRMPDPAAPDQVLASFTLQSRSSFDLKRSANRSDRSTGR